MDTVTSPFALDGKIALVTGGSSGLGAATAKILSGCGARVVINYLDHANDAQLLADELRENGGLVDILPGDVSSEESVLEIFARIRESHGKLDILVNNAGIARQQDIFDTALQDWNEVMDVNLTGCFLCCREAMKMMRVQSAGRIVNISSVVAHQGSLYGPVHYAASKSGMLGLTKTLARTAAPFGVTVNAVAPGIIATDLLYKTNGRATVDDLARKVPLGLGLPRDVGLAVAFLASDAARYITGATLDVNGGMYLR